MALPTIFATLSGGNQPLSLFDVNFNAVSTLGAIPCAATGSNAISLTPLANTPTVASYVDLQPSFVFAAALTSTSSVTIQVNALGARNCYKWNGQTPLGAGDIVAGNVYRATPLAALNGGLGGFVVDAIGTSVTLSEIPFIISGAGSPITASLKGYLPVPFPGTITAWEVMGDQSGSIVIDIFRANEAIPTVSMIGAGNKPNLTSQQFTGAAVSGWTSTALAIKDWLGWNVTSASVVTQVTVVLYVTKT
jgi:hypothetical protein